MPGPTFHPSPHPFHAAHCFLAYQPSASHPAVELHEVQTTRFTI